MPGGRPAGGQVGGAPGHADGGGRRIGRPVFGEGGRRGLRGGRGRRRDRHGGDGGNRGGRGGRGGGAEAGRVDGDQRVVDAGQQAHPDESGEQFVGQAAGEAEGVAELDAAHPEHPGGGLLAGEGHGAFEGFHVNAGRGPGGRVGGQAVEAGAALLAVAAAVLDAAHVGQGVADEAGVAAARRGAVFDGHADLNDLQPVAGVGQYRPDRVLDGGPEGAQGAVHAVRADVELDVAAVGVEHAVGFELREDGAAGFQAAGEGKVGGRLVKFTNGDPVLAEGDCEGLQAGSVATWSRHRGA